jgi:hypothetical protein
MATLTQAEAHRLFEYRDGVLYWKVRPQNSRKSKDDNTAGTVTTGGYVKVTIAQKKYYAHQIVFLMQHGYIPGVIDHIDGNTSNNRIDNLRESSKSFNACNSIKRSDNTSGHRGVVWHKKANKWMCQVNLKGKQIYLGLHEDFDLACLVADEARSLYHGEHARL